MKAGDRVRTKLGWEGTLLGFIELSTGEQRAAVELDEPNPTGLGANFYPPNLLTVIKEETPDVDE